MNSLANMKTKLPLLFAFLGLLLAPVASRAADGVVRHADNDRFFDLITVGNQRFTNVTVSPQTNQNILIRHLGGIETIKLNELPQEEIDELKPQLGELMQQTEPPPGFEERLAELENNEEVQMLLQQLTEQLEAMGPMFFVALGLIWLAGYLLFSLCIHLIYKKVKGETTALAWVPVLQTIPMIQAAGLSAWTLVLWIIPFVNIVAVVHWSVRVCTARGKSGWLAILNFIPGLNLFFLPYLAFSK